MTHLNRKNHRGFAVLLSVLVLAAIGAAIASTLLTLSINNAQTTAAIQESEQAKGLATACAELALQKLVTSAVFLGTVNVTLGQGSCTYTIAQLDTLNSVINVTAMVGTTVRKVQIKIALASLLITTWQEVADF